MTPTPVNPDGLVDATEIGYSQAVVADGTLYVSGQVGWNDAFEVAGDDVASQGRKALDNLDALLSSVDSGLEDVVKVTSYVVDPHSRVGAYLEVFGEAFPAEPYPAHTILGVEQLAREELLVEVEAEVPDAAVSGQVTTA